MWVPHTDSAPRRDPVALNSGDCWVAQTMMQASDTASSESEERMTQRCHYVHGALHPTPELTSSSYPLSPRNLAWLWCMTVFFQTVEEIEGVLGRDLYPNLAEERSRWEKELAGLREENESLTAMLCSKEEELNRTKATMNAIREERDRLRRRVSMQPGLA